MRETPAGLWRRTSIAYAPSERVRAIARPLAAREPCPTLFRYPGPCGLADFFAGALAALAPGALVWMSARTVVEDSLGARLFGTLAVLQPLRFHCGLVRAGSYAGDPRALDAGDALVWLPPSLLDARLPWDELATAGDAARHLRAADARERPAVVDELCAYLEELDAMRRSGAPGPGVPWHRVPEAERRRRLAEAGVAPWWTGMACTAARAAGTIATP